MKLIGLKETSLAACINEAQHERIVITRDGKPVALVVGVEGLDAEQLELGSSAKFWELITQRRQQRTVSRVELEKKSANPPSVAPTLPNPALQPAVPLPAKNARLVPAAERQVGRKGYARRDHG